MKLDVHLKTGETYKESFMDKVRYAIMDGVDWFVENKETILVVTLIGVSTVLPIVKIVGKRSNLNKQEAIKNLYCYDRQLGHYWNLRRELSNNEWLTIEARKKSGERLSDILSSMKVLK